MQALIVGAIAAIAGILVGFWLRGASAKGEKAQLELRNAELTRDLNTARSEIAQLQAESAARAGYESLAAEREKTISQLSAESGQLRSDLKAKGEEASKSASIVAELNAKLESERKNLAEKLALLETAKKSLSDQFEALAAGILEKKARSFSEGSQKEIGTLIEPLKTQIKEFREKVEQAQSDSKTGVTKLETLIGALNGLNQQLSEDARNLTTALRGSSKAQGDWGEFILRDLLEKAGLREGEQFSFQQTFNGIEGDDGKRTKAARTDVIVFLPGGRNLVIDSKVSLTAYTDYANAGADGERNAALKQHLASVRGHVTGLAKAGYDRLPGIETPDFVVMFVPVEPAFLLALQNDAALWADAYQQGILLVGPTTLLYIIRIVNVLWQQEAQSRNVKEVMDRGAKLYEKFVGFVNDIEEIGRSLRDASQSYEDARKKLSVGDGNLIRQVEMLRQLGVKPRKPLPAKLLEIAEVEEPGLALAAEAEDSSEAAG
ncbi:MAG: DNA recombination protein RmuC [Acidobacteriota bacterium]|nr:DNA recombination protein RmuC [Acidobacteriota bacterium]